MEEIEKELEGEKRAADALEGTSPSGEGGVDLSSAPTPTAEEMADAGMPQSDPQPEQMAGQEAQAEGTATGGMPQSAQDAGDGLPPAESNVGQEAQPQPAAPAERTFTQSQVNDLVGRTRMETREQTYRAMYGRYGVEDEAGMDELVGNAQRYETVRGEYDEARKGWETSDKAKSAELSEIKEHVALLESGIDKARFDDAKAIIKSKGLEVTVESINNELATHPEWKGAGQQAQAEPNPDFRKDPSAQPAQMPEHESTISVLGNEGNQMSDEMSEEDYALKKVFKFER